MTDPDTGGTGVSDQEQAKPAKDPMKSFRGVFAGTLVLEAIVVALALPIVAQLGSGFSSVQGWTVLAVVVALLACCALLNRRFTPWVCVALQAGLIAFVVTLPSIAVVGIIFVVVLLWLLGLRRKVAARMAAGTLPSQQEQS